jgi:signal peptidase
MNVKNFFKFNKADRTKVLNILAIVVSVLLLPILLTNCLLIIKGMMNSDEVPSLGKVTPLVVLTESMEPEIMSGDLIICKKINAGDVKEGDVISFFDPEGNGSSVVTHRVIALVIEDGALVGFRTQGDNNDIEDRLTVPTENLVGLWTGKRFGGLGNLVLFTQSPLGIVIFLILPICAFVLYEVLRRQKQDQAKQNDIDVLRAELEALRNGQAQATAETPSTSDESEAETPPAVDNSADEQ